MVTPFFEAFLTSGPLISHAVWVIGPISGLIVAPVIGSMSDKCVSAYGRRRPFILLVSVSSILALSLFSKTPSIVSFFFPRDHSSYRSAALAFGVFDFAFLCVALSVLMRPTRALPSDLLPESQQHALQSAIVICTSLSDLAINSLLNSFHRSVSHIALLYHCQAIVIATLTLLLFYIGREQ